MSVLGTFLYKTIIRTKRKLSKKVKLSEPDNMYTDIFKFLLRNKDSNIYQCVSLPGRYVTYKDFLVVIDKQKLSVQSDTINTETLLPEIVCIRLEDEFDKEMSRRIRHHMYERKLQGKSILTNAHSLCEKEFYKVMGEDKKI